jgi:hypothetical protein
VMWHHDLIDYTPARRAWADAAQEFLDLYVSPEPPDTVAGNAVQILPGCRLITDRGPGKRPTTLTYPDDDAAVLFFGNHLAGSRRETLEALAQSALPVRAYGSIPQIEGVEKCLTVCENTAAQLARRAWATVSVSATWEVDGYTSIRLFNACGGGSVVLVEWFEGLDDLYPAEAAVVFDDSEDLKEAVAGLAKLPRALVRRRAVEHTYRHHTWDDRVEELLVHVEAIQ